MNPTSTYRITTYAVIAMEAIRSSSDDPSS